MADHTDDWMNPRQSRRWALQDAKTDPRPFLIQRQKRIVCSWVGSGPPTEWALWTAHKTREERDAELRRLRKEHPAWHLRPAYEQDRLGHRIVTVEDEEADLIARLHRIRSQAKGAA